ncbi:Nitrogen assimilation transcription factor nirA 3 [Seiridium cupressi]
MSQIIGMAKRLQEAEATIIELKKALAEQMAVEAEKSPTPGMASEELTAAATHSIPRARAAIPRPAYGLSNSGSNASRESTTAELLSDLSLDASGKICYYGSTSAVHDPAAFAGRSPNFPSFEEQNSKVDVRTLLTSNAMESRTWEEFAIGNAAVQAWTYSGIAFRMVSDLGLRHSSGSIYSLGSLNAEDLEIRRRLFWSCYFWDKAMSLYLGRIPALTELPSTHAPELLDGFAEHDLWVPDDTGPAGSDKAPASGFPPMKFHVVSCFVNSCKLAVIISDIILHLYSSHHGDDGDITLRAIRERLDDWRALTPEHLKLEPDNLPSRCPPPHIVSQNLLYYATIILLHRPFNSLPIHHAACRQAADSAERLLILFERTFGFTKLSYLSAYCIYTSASVMVQDAKAGDALASRKTETFLRALNVAAKTCQLIQRSLDIITNSLNAEGTRPAAVGKSNQTSENNLLNRQYLPAFLYRDAQINFPSTSNHMENSSTRNWYLPS